MGGVGCWVWGWGKEEVFGHHAFMPSSLWSHRTTTAGDLSQPLKLFGEDALLDWPGAMGPIIRDRDTYMAKAMAAAATGEPCLLATQECNMGVAAECAKDKQRRTTCSLAGFGYC